MQEQQLWTWGLPLALLLVALMLLLPWLRKKLEQRRMDKRIAAIGTAQLKNVLLDDGMGGQSFYERLLLTPSGILALFTNDRHGIIFGGERMDVWAQVLGKRTIRFTNPLYHIDTQLSTLRYHLPKVAVSGNVLFVGDCSFPKGKPEGVWTLEDLAVGSDEQSQPLNPQFQTAWDAISQHARNIDPARDSYLLPIVERSPLARFAMALLLVGAAIAWLFWRLM